MNKPMSKEQLTAAAARAAMSGGQPNRQPKVDLETMKKGEDMCCMNQIPKFNEEGNIIEGETVQCGNKIFVDVHNMKYVSPIMSPVGMPTIGAIMIGKCCAKCGKFFNPEEWLQERDKKEAKEDEGEKDAKTELPG